MACCCSTQLFGWRHAELVCSVVPSYRSYRLADMPDYKRHQPHVAKGALDEADPQRPHVLLANYLSSLSPRRCERAIFCSNTLCARLCIREGEIDLRLQQLPAGHEPLCCQWPELCRVQYVNLTKRIGLLRVL